MHWYYKIMVNFKKLQIITAHLHLTDNSLLRLDEANLQGTNALLTILFSICSYNLYAMLAICLRRIPSSHLYPWSTWRWYTAKCVEGWDSPGSHVATVFFLTTSISSLGFKFVDILELGGGTFFLRNPITFKWGVYAPVCSTCRQAPMAKIDAVGL